MNDTEDCPICDEPMTDDQETVWWREIMEVHRECNPAVNIGPFAMETDR